MSTVRDGDRLIVWKGERGGDGLFAVAIADPSEMGGTPVVRVQFVNGATDYIALTHVQRLDTPA